MKALSLKSTLIVTLYLTITITFTSSVSPIYDHEWSQFKLNHGKVYKSSDEESYRRNIFFDNLKFINEHNARADQRKLTYKLGVNQFADKTREEMESMYGVKMPTIPRHKFIPFTEKSKSNLTLPKSIDWRTKKIVTRVRYQGACGSCWAFSTIASVESAYAQKTGKLVELSEQNLVDCVTKSQGCKEGYVSYAFDYIKQKGVDRAECYPYVSSLDLAKRKCSFNSTCSEVKIKDYKILNKRNDEDALMRAVSQRVVTVQVDGHDPDFLYYKKGIIDSPTCGANGTTHAVAIVGYGSENGVPYWIIKNSYGTKWGEKGYARLIRGKNMCQIASICYAPVLE